MALGQIVTWAKCRNSFEASKGSAGKPMILESVTDCKQDMETLCTPHPYDVEIDIKRKRGRPSKPKKASLTQ